VIRAIKKVAQEVKRYDRHPRESEHQQHMRQGM
jgi:hypothetical protein